MLAALLVGLALASPPPALDPQHLPTLPSQGIARAAGNDVVLETLRGRVLGRLPALGLASPRATHGLLLTDRHDRLFTIDFSKGRVRKVFRKPERFAGCRFADETVRNDLLLCGRRIDVVRASRRTVLALAPDRHGGSWEWA